MYTVVLGRRLNDEGREKEGQCQSFRWDLEKDGE
jgi:hypothetical protein